MQAVIQHVVAVVGWFLLYIPSSCKLRKDNVNRADIIQQLKPTEYGIGGAFAVLYIGKQYLVQVLAYPLG